MAGNNGHSAATSIKTQSALALELGVSRRTLSDWTKQPDFPRRNDAGYPLADCIRWQAARSNGHSGGDADLREKKLRAEIDKLRADARAKEIKNAVSMRDLLPADQVMHYLSSSAVLVKSRLETLADAIAAEMPPRHKVEARRIAAAAVNRLLTELSAPAFVSGMPDDDNDGDD